MIKSDRRNEFLESLSVRSFDRNKEGTSTCYLVVLVMSFERKQKILQKRGLRSIWHHLNNDKIELHRILNRIFLLSLAEIVPVLCSSLQLTNVLTIRINNPPVPLITQMIICLHLHLGWGHWADLNLSVPGKCFITPVRLLAGVYWRERCFLYFIVNDNS